MYATRACLYLSALLVTSCVFEPDEDDNFHVVNPDAEVEPIQIDLDLAGDTVEVYSAAYFKYDISGFDPSKHYTILFLAESENQSKQQFSGEIYYYPQIDSGYVKATLRVFTRAGTNSLADRLGAEHAVYERSWILHVYRRAPRPVKIISIARSEGALKVTWEKYDKINFQQYNLIRKRGYSTEWVKTITDPDSAFYIDHNYVGGEISYQIILLTKSGDNSQGIISTYTDNVPELVHYEYASESQLKIYWSASRYPANLKRYEIYEGAAYSGSTENLIYSTTNPKDTTFTFLPPFGKPGSITVKSYGTLAQYDPEVVYSEKEYVFGEKIEPFEHIYFASSINRYFTIYQGKLRAFTVNGNQLMAETPYTLSVSPPPLILSKDNTELLTIVGVNTILSFDTQTLQIKEETNLSSLLAAGEYFQGLGITADNKLLLSKSTGIAGGNLLFYNRDTHTVEKEYTGVGVRRYLELYEKDNDYVLGIGNGTYVFKLGPGNASTYVYASSTEEGHFDPANDYQVIAGTDEPLTQGSILRWDFKNGVPMGQTVTPLIRTLDMDVEANQIVGAMTDGGSVAGTVFDYKNQLTLMRCSKLTGYVLRLNQNYLYSGNGVRLKLPR